MVQLCHATVAIKLPWSYAAWDNNENETNGRVDIASNFVLLERAVAQFDSRFTLRALRSISSLRKRLTPQVLTDAILSYYPQGNEMGKKLVAAIGGSVQSSKTSEANSKKDVVPEVDVYLAILIQVRMTAPTPSKTGPAANIMPSVTGAVLRSTRFF